MLLNIRELELLSGMNNERLAAAATVVRILPPAPVRPELLMYVGFIAEIKSSCLWFGQLKFNLRPTLSRAGRNCALPATFMALRLANANVWAGEINPVNTLGQQNCW